MKRTPLKRKTAIKRGGKLNPFSKSPHKVERRIKRNKAMQEYKEATPFCQIPGCHNRTQDVHHRAGSAGVLIHEKRFFMALCRPCHDRIHHTGAGKKEAYEKGYLLAPDIALRLLEEKL
jgi:hypothetical protein